MDSKTTTGNTSFSSSSHNLQYNAKKEETDASALQTKEIQSPLGGNTFISNTTNVKNNATAKLNDFSFKTNEIHSIQGPIDKQKNSKRK